MLQGAGGWPAGLGKDASPGGHGRSARQEHGEPPAGSLGGSSEGPETDTGTEGTLRTMGTAGKRNH